ncbi:hypothetical protein LTR37_004074 [Vermiconidia calcicola]|uniref:Uncharacterized protein n=1 Tax=Vermiconidia calcicola TaxID=1690605 RepID=A0ACC3NMX7_9PEZI|nr:hypothetical protein LTR37_004074 [Vermiconidia calcicola]
MHFVAPFAPSAPRRDSGYDTVVEHVDPNAPEHEGDFFKFVTRPDITAPRWNIRKHNGSAISPGYWFVGPYQDPTQDERGGAWVGPHIYSGDGELVWSGVPEFKGFDAFDFRVSNVLGEDQISLMYRHENALVLDEGYEVVKRLGVNDVEDGEVNLNMHDVNFVNRGKSALLLKTIEKEATDEILENSGLGYDDGCRVRYYGFEELNATTGETLFSWSSEGHVGLEESYLTRNRKKRCRSDTGWDYIHANAIDKFPDGDYLLSGRHCNTIYKISHKDGSIVWRLAGSPSDSDQDGKGMSDFTFPEHFSGQHDVRVRAQNSSHTLISFLDNAEIPQAEPRTTNEFSRGFVLLLRTDRKPMTAEVVHKYNHPHGEYAPGRGSYQVLPGGNTFIGWTSYALHTEYDAHGNLVLEAQMLPKLKSYRSYKFPWIGRPRQPPDVHSVAIGSIDNETVITSVHVSWNGATEVGSWTLYKTDSNGTERELIAATHSRGFETGLLYEGYASHVIVEALDAQGDTLGESDVVATILSSKDLYNPAVLDEEAWLQSHALENGLLPSSSRARGALDSLISSPVTGFLLGMVVCAAVVLVIAAFWHGKETTAKVSGWWRKLLPRRDGRGWGREKDEEAVVFDGEEITLVDQKDDEGDGEEDVDEEVKEKERLRMKVEEG